MLLYAHKTFDCAENEQRCKFERNKNSIYLAPKYPNRKVWIGVAQCLLFDIEIFFFRMLHYTHIGLAFCVIRWVAKSITNAFHWKSDQIRIESNETSYGDRIKQQQQQHVLCFNVCIKL